MRGVLLLAACALAWAEGPVVDPVLEPLRDSLNPVAPVAHAPARKKGQTLPRDCPTRLGLLHPDWLPEDLGAACLGGSDPWFGRGSCAARLAELHFGWKAAELNAACAGVDADCVISMANVHQDWDALRLNQSCRRRQRE